MSDGNIPVNFEKIARPAKIQDLFSRLPVLYATATFSLRGMHSTLRCVIFISERELRYMLSPFRLSSVCLSVGNARAPYSGGCNFRQYFYGIRYHGHPFTFTENFTEIVPGNLSAAGVKHKRGIAKYSDFGPIDGCISETVQDRR